MCENVGRMMVLILVCLVQVEALVAPALVATKPASGTCACASSEPARVHAHVRRLEGHNCKAQHLVLPALPAGVVAAAPKHDSPVSITVMGNGGLMSVAPENTLASMRAAKALGCKVVSVTCMLSKDKVAVVHHDTSLSRCTTGNGDVGEHTLEELVRLDAGAHFGPEFAGEKIPRLSEVLEECRQLSLLVNLEVKHSTSLPSTVLQIEELAQVVSETVARSKMLPTDLTFSSFCHATLNSLKRFVPQYTRTLVVSAIPSDWHTFTHTKVCSAIMFDHSRNSAQLIETCARSGLQMWAYNVNSGDRAMELVSLGVRAVASDYPHVIQDHLDRLLKDRHQQRRLETLRHFKEHQHSDFIKIILAEIEEKRRNRLAARSRPSSRSPLS